MKTKYQINWDRTANSMSLASRLVFQLAPPVGPAGAPPGVPAAAASAPATLPNVIDPPPNLEAKETRKQLDALDKDTGFNKLVYKMANIYKVDFFKWYNANDFRKVQSEFFEIFDKELPQHQQKPFFEKMFNTLNGPLPKDSQEYKDAKAAFDAFMHGIIEVKLNQLSNQKKVEEEKLNETDGGAFDKVKEVGNNLLMAWKEGEPMDKGIMVLAGFIVWKAFDKLKDKTIPGTSIKYSEALTWAGGFWAINLIAKKATGKSALEWAGVTDPRKDLKETEYAKMAYSLKIEDPDLQKTMLEVGQSDAKMPNLIALYANQAQLQPGVGFIDPIAAGLNISPGDKDIYEKKGKQIFILMWKLQNKIGGFDELQNRYGSDIDQWTFAGAIWNEYNLESFKQRAGLMDRAMNAAYGVLGYRKHESADIHKFLDKFRLPDTYKWNFSFVDDNSTPLDNKFDMKINNIPVTVEHIIMPGTGDNKPEGVSITVKGTGKKVDFEVGPNGGNLKVADLNVFYELMRGDLNRRLTNVTLQGAPGKKLEAKDITWDAPTNSWIAGEVTIPPSVDDTEVLKGRARIIPVGDNDVSIMIEGSGLKLDIFNELKNAPPDHLRFVARVANSPEFRPVLDGIAPNIRIIDKVGDRAKIQLGGAILPLQFRLKPGDTKKAWHIDLAAGPDALKNFVTHDDVIQAKIETATREGSPLASAMKQLRGNFEAAPESYWKHAGAGLATYLGEVWHDLGSNLPAPTAEIFSGSVPELYAEARLDAIQKEAVTIYGLALANLKNRTVVTATDIELAYNESILLVTEKLKQIDMRFKVMTEQKALQHGEWSTEEIFGQLDTVAVAPYRNTTYNIEMQRFRDQVYTLDYQGLDKSDWATKAHLVREKLIGVFFYYTKEFAADPYLDDIDYAAYETDIKNAESIMRSLSATPADPRYIKASRDRDVAKVKYDHAKENMNKKLYMSYVRTQVFTKALEFAGKPMDITIREIDLRPAGHQDWNVMPFNNWKAYGPMLPEQMYELMPKLKATEIKRQMENLIEAEYATASKISNIDQLKIDAIKADMLTTAGKLEIMKIAGNVANLPSRFKQEQFLIAYQLKLKEMFQADVNRDPQITGQGWLTRSYDWTVDKLKMLWPGNWV